MANDNLAKHINGKMTTYSLGLELVDGLKLGIEVVGDSLEALDGLLGLVNDGLVLEDATVMGEINGGGLGLELSEDTLGLIVALTEGLERGSGLLGEAGAQLGPVELLDGGAKRCHVELLCSIEAV